MCASFRSAAESFGIVVMDKELPNSGTSGGQPSADALKTIEEVLKEIHNDLFQDFRMSSEASELL